MLLSLVRGAQRSSRSPPARYVYNHRLKHEGRPARAVPSFPSHQQHLPLARPPASSPLPSPPIRASSSSARRPKASPPSPPPPRRWTLLPTFLNPLTPHFYHFWRYFLLIFLGLALPFHYIRSTTVYYYTIQGMSMFPLLRPGISEARAEELGQDRDVVERYARSGGAPRERKGGGEEEGEGEESAVGEEDTTGKKGKRKRKSESGSRGTIQPQDHDQLLTIPPLRSTSLFTPRPLLSSFLLRLSSLFGVLFDPTAHDYRLSDDPTSEGGTGAKSNIERGMVVVFRAPYEPERLAVKRVVGLEGDVVVPVGTRVGDEGAVARGRRALVRVWREAGDGEGEGWGCAGRWVEGEVRGEGPGNGDGDEDGNEVRKEGILIPYGHIWVEGVNQDETFDSNDCGPISKSLITGIGVHVWWPLGRSLLWRESWDEDCYGRVFRLERGGVLRMVERLEGVGNGEEEGMESVPEEWVIH